MLLAVTPPRAGERTLLGVENLLQSIAVPEPFSLELAAERGRRDADGPLPRRRRGARPDIRPLPPGPHREGCTPARTTRCGSDDGRAGLVNDASGPTVPSTSPCSTFRDDDLLDPGSDPLIALMGALTALNDGERVVARLMLRSLGPDWSQSPSRKGPQEARLWSRGSPPTPTRPSRCRWTA